jgi:trk system potassium uptake protein TrkA
MSPPRQTTVETASQGSNGPVFVIGGGLVGRDVADRLTASGEAVTFVDRSPPTDPPPCESIHVVDTLDTESFRALDFADVDAALVLEPEDAPNLFVAQLLRSKYDVSDVVVRVNDPGRVNVFDNVGVETVDATAAIGRAVERRW